MSAAQISTTEIRPDVLGREASEKCRAAYVIGHTMADDFADHDLVGDVHLFYRLGRLADLPRPLITLNGNTNILRGIQVQLTPFGERVCQGLESSLPENPIDEWVGGVHVSSNAGRIWLYDGETLQNAGST